MLVETTPLEGVLLIKPSLYTDVRGFFMETWQLERYASLGLPRVWMQDNYSRSIRGTIRGLHYQYRHPQAKLVTVTAGKVFDVVVDLRQHSSTLGKWWGIELSDDNHWQLYVPPGFAHGFCVLSEHADFFYKCSALYDPQDEYTLLWCDTQVGIVWPSIEPRLISAKDQQGRAWGNLPLFD
ncbi:MAG: dTDP-4-dehydrorhamnose 3,5-epimerase [Planctomycetaceae bacterium]|nr:MAG: dTDP-4-dehydrorhamnose 3,5-epimerase [Planctomycetaceae bacterium]